MLFLNFMVKKTNSNPTSAHKVLSLETICLANNALKPFYKKGIGALKKVDKQYISVPDPKLLSGSVALDDATIKEYPTNNRWDYAIEYDGNTFFLEVHPASTSEIDCIIKKVKFIKEWLGTNCSEFFKLPIKGSKVHCFYWISSGGTDLRILPGSQQAKKMAQYNIKNVGNMWIYAKLFK